MDKQIRRVDAPAETRWMIHGSYVLDVVFDVSNARDLDVAFDPLLRHPTQEEVLDRLSELQLPKPPQTIQFTRCHDFSVPEAAGFPCFNIDFWQLHMDGQVYVADPESHSHHLLTDSDPRELSVVAHEQLTGERAKAALEKMTRYPQLRTEAMISILGESVMRDSLLAQIRNLIAQGIAEVHWDGIIMAFAKCCHDDDPLKTVVLSAYSAVFDDEPPKIRSEEFEAFLDKLGSAVEACHPPAILKVMYEVADEVGQKDLSVALRVAFEFAMFGLEDPG